MAHNIVLGVNIHAHYLQTQTIARNIFIQYAFNIHRNHVNQTLSILSKRTIQETILIITIYQKCKYFSIQSNNYLNLLLGKMKGKIARYVCKYVKTIQIKGRPQRYLMVKMVFDDQNRTKRKYASFINKVSCKQD